MEERTFQGALEKLRQSASRDELSDGMVSTLNSLLSHPDDLPLLNKLVAQTASITNNLPAGRGGAQSAALRQAAVRCVVILETAKRRAKQDGGATKGMSKEKRRLIIIAASALATSVLYFLLLATK